jgi:hypothetical protein
VVAVSAASMIIFKANIGKREFIYSVLQQRRMHYLARYFVSNKGDMLHCA